MRAPAFSKAASAWNAPSPAPVSTSTSSPLFTSAAAASGTSAMRRSPGAISRGTATFTGPRSWADGAIANGRRRERSEEHTSELQSRRELVCRLLLEKKKTSGALSLIGRDRDTAGGGDV